jgi:quercetin dioxygenase-like cupin family protein
MAKAMFDAATVQDANLLAATPVLAGAIVSKTLVNTAGCKLIVFAMDVGQVISEHHAPYVATVQVLDGKLEFGVAGQKRTMTANDWLVMPFDTKHDLVALAPTRFLLTLLK